MTNGFLVNPDLSHRIISFELSHAQQFLGGVTDDRVSVAFQEDGTTYAALFNSSAKSEGAAPNPVASLGHNKATTGNAAFFSDPTAAVYGPVIFINAEGDDISLDEVARIKRGIQAVKNYIQDQPQEYQLWVIAATNLAERSAE